MIAVHSAWIDTSCSQCDARDRREWPSDDPLPDRALLGAAQRIGLAARQHRRHAGPEELGRQRRHEGRNADLGDEEAVDEADQDPGRQARDDGEPAEIVFLEQHGEDEAGKGDDRGKAEIDFAGPDHEGQARREQDQRRQGGKEGRVDIGREENLRRPVHEQAEQKHEDDDDRQRLEALHERNA